MEVPLNSPHLRISRNITSILIEARLVDDEQVERGVLRQRETGLRIGETLVEMGVVTEEDIGWALSRQLGLSLVDLDPTSLDSVLVCSFPEPLLRRTGAVPLVRESEAVSIAVADPTDHESLAQLEEAAGRPLHLCVATPTGIRGALDAIFGAHVVPGQGAHAEPHADLVVDVVWERSGASFLSFHVVMAMREGCSQIQLIPDAGLVTVFYRDGSGLRPVAREPGQVLEYLLSRIEALGGPTIGQGVHAQGVARCPLPGSEVPLEVSLLRGDRGISVTLTPRPTQAEVASLETLGMNPLDAARLRSSLEIGAGLILVCGPRRSGASATLAALAAATPPDGGRLLAFEPGPSAPLPTATRLHLPLEQSRETWEEIVQAQDADIVVLDEVLTGASVSGVLSPAGSRRLLLVRTDWSDSFALLDYLAEQTQGRCVLAGRLLAVIQQRGVRSPRPLDSPTALFEVLHVTEALREAIVAGADGQRLRQLAAEDGFVSLAVRARERVDAGTLTAIEAARAQT